jgi:hypothetical protein
MEPLQGLCLAEMFNRKKKNDWVEHTLPICK